MKSAADKLKGRQLEILQRIAQGEKRTAIAADLKIHIGTLNTYADRLFRRLGARNAAHAVLLYAQQLQPKLRL